MIILVVNGAFELAANVSNATVCRSSDFAIPFCNTCKTITRILFMLIEYWTKLDARICPEILHQAY